MIGSMLLYGITFAMSLSIATLLQRKGSNWLMFILCLAPAVFTATIRHGVGTDYFGYVQTYYHVERIFSPSLIFSYHQEPLNVLIYRAASIIFGNPVGMFFLYSWLTLSFILLGIISFRDMLSIPFSLFIFFMTYYHVTFNGMRQMLAVAIVFYGFRYIIDRKFASYLIVIVIATMVHKSAFIAVLFYFLGPEKNSKVKNRRTHIYYLTILATPIVVPLVARILPVVTSILGIYHGYTLRPGQQNLNFLLYIVPMTAVIVLYRRRILRWNDKTDFFVKTTLLQIPLQSFGYFVAYADRLALYAGVAQVVLMPMLVSSIQPKRERALVTVILVFWYIFYYSVMFIVLGSNQVYPFVSIFD